MNRNIPIVLSIAGSDPSGGAGIQADLKTVSALGGYAAAAITAVTVQNTLGVTQVQCLPAALVSSQIQAVLEDLAPDAVKIGMTGSVSVVRAIAGTLRQHGQSQKNGAKRPHIVFDPVMASTGAHPLTTPEGIGAMGRELFPLCTLVTPNLNETGLLLGREIRSVEDMEKAARELYLRYGCAFLVKGGDRAGARESIDILCNENGLQQFRSPHICSRNLHGTGCTLSSAIATGLGFGLDLKEALLQAKSYISAAIAAAQNLQIGHGHGPLWHFCDKGYPLHL